MNSPEGFIGKQDAAKVAGCKIRTIDNWMKKRLLPFYKFGRRVYFKREDILKSINDSRVDHAVRHFQPVPSADAAWLWDYVIGNLQTIERRATDPKHRNLARDLLRCIAKFEV